MNELEWLGAETACLWEELDSAMGMDFCYPDRPDWIPESLDAASLEASLKLPLESQIALTPMIRSTGEEFSRARAESVVNDDEKIQRCQTIDCRETENKTQGTSASVALSSAEGAFALDGTELCFCCDAGFLVSVDMKRCLWTGPGGSTCKKAYHVSCIAPYTVLAGRNQPEWLCPRHYCHHLNCCSIPAFECRSCPVAYCSIHLPRTVHLSGGEDLTVPADQKMTCHDVVHTILCYFCQNNGQSDIPVAKRLQDGTKSPSVVMPSPSATLMLAPLPEKYDQHFSGFQPDSPRLKHQTRQHRVCDSPLSAGVVPCTSNSSESGEAKAEGQDAGVTCCPSERQDAEQGPLPRHESCSLDAKNENEHSFATDQAPTLDGMGRVEGNQEASAGDYLALPSQDFIQSAIVAGVPVKCYSRRKKVKLEVAIAMGLQAKPKKRQSANGNGNDSMPVKSSPRIRELHRKEERRKRFLKELL